LFVHFAEGPTLLIPPASATMRPKTQATISAGTLTTRVEGFLAAALTYRLGTGRPVARPKRIKRPQETASAGFRAALSSLKRAMPLDTPDAQVKAGGLLRNAP
jgi:hypothetical protein